MESDPESDPFHALQSRIGHEFRNAALLRQALTHSSVLKEVSGVPDNQRLEFLGDAVLDLALADELFRRFPKWDEGLLSKARAHFVNNNSALAGVARELGLGDAILMGRGEEASGGRNRESILADAYEALVGAVFLDGGFNAARDFVLRSHRERLEHGQPIQLISNPKGDLQELLQSGEQTPVVYRMESASGPDHAKRFECSVHYGGTELGRGDGASKQAAEKAAASNAVQSLLDGCHPEIHSPAGGGKKKGGGKSATRKSPR
jgi:ribonuclease III